MGGLSEPEKIWDRPWFSVAMCKFIPPTLQRSSLEDSDDPYHPSFSQKKDGAPGLVLLSIPTFVPTFVPVDVAEGFVLLCNYTGKEVV